MRRIWRCHSARGASVRSFAALRTTTGPAHAEPGRARFCGTRHAGAPAGAAGDLLAAAADPAAAAAGALSGNPAADRARAFRADADEDAVVAAAAAPAAGDGADPRGGPAAAQPAGRAAGQGPAVDRDRRRLVLRTRLDHAHRACR